MTALLEYLDLAFITRRWFSHYNWLDWNLILLNNWMALQSWLLHPLTNRRSGILLVILDCTIITYRWFFHYIFMVFSLISLKPQKIWGSIVNLANSVPIFSFLPFAVYPVSVTTYWYYFSWIIANNFTSVYRILSFWSPARM